jgi:hypothetical protein
VGGGDDEAGSGLDAIGLELQPPPGADHGGLPSRPGPAAIARAACPRAVDGSRPMDRDIDKGSMVVTAPDQSAPAGTRGPIADGDSPPGPRREDQPHAKSEIDLRAREQAPPPLPQPRSRSVPSASPVSSPAVRKTDQHWLSTTTIQDPLRAVQAATPPSDVRSPTRPAHGFPADRTRPAPSPTSPPAVHIRHLEIHVDAAKPSTHEPARTPVRLNGSSCASRIYLRKT